MVFAGHPDSLGAAATLEAARDGPVLGPIPPGWARIHQPRIDAALDHIATSLDQGAYASARQRGAAMTYDEIIAFTLDQLARIAAQ